MYEVHWHSLDGSFSHCSVSPITVIREGVLPGCTGVSITVKDVKGRRFQGSPQYYYVTEDAAWEAIKNKLASSIEDDEKELEKLQLNLSVKRDYLAKLLPK